jgi:hypothetical protein
MDNVKKVFYFNEMINVQCYQKNATILKVYICLCFTLALVSLVSQHT